MFISFHFSSVQETRCIQSAKGIAQKNMSTEWLKGYSIPLPPTHEQLRIVERIESIFAKLDEAKEKALQAEQETRQRAENEGKVLTYEEAQELIDCIWVKLNDLNKVRDAASADGFAGYGMFQNLIVGGQNIHGMDSSNDLSYMCIEAAMHVPLPQPSISIRVWNGSPESLLIKAAALTRLGTGLPAYYNDEVIIPSLMSRGVSLEDARELLID